MYQSIRNKLSIHPFCWEDPQEMNGLAESMTGLGMLHKDPAYCMRLEQSGPAYTVRNGSGRILGCGGVGLHWNGVGEGWLILAPEVVHYPKSLHKMVSKLLQKIKDENHVHRIQVTAHWNNPVAHHWLQRLGFKREGWMPGFSPDGQCFARYAWVRPDLQDAWESNMICSILKG